jgi:hypothetical protein
MSDFLSSLSFFVSEAVTKSTWSFLRCLRCHHFTRFRGLTRSGLKCACLGHLQRFATEALPLLSPVAIFLGIEKLISLLQKYIILISL